MVIEKISTPVAKGDGGMKEQSSYLLIVLNCLNWEDTQMWSRAWATKI